MIKVITNIVPVKHFLHLGRLSLVVQLQRKQDLGFNLIKLRTLLLLRNSKLKINQKKSKRNQRPLNKHLLLLILQLLQGNHPSLSFYDNRRRESIMNSTRSSTLRGSQTKQQLFDDLSKVIFVDSSILNYATFFPGKLLGSTLTVGNLTNSEQIVELSVDASTYTYNKKNIK